MEPGRNLLPERNGQPGRVGLLLSGGLDSSILLGYLLGQGYHVRPIYVRCGLVWESAELAAVWRILRAFEQPRLEPLVVLDFPVADIYGSHWSITGENIPGEDSPPEAVFLPGRNACLLLKAGVWCLLHGISALALGILGTNPFADARPEFLTKIEEILESSMGQPVRILTPFVQMDKKSVMNLGKGLPLELSFSCIAPKGGLHCGCCNKCAERREAFALAALPDPTAYAPSPTSEVLP
jgi:7-cyano-7-deazaguanine synthase